MNAPPVEIFLRLAVAVMATFLFALLSVGWHAPRMPARPLYRFLWAVIGMQMAFRWFILWLGFQADLRDLGWIVPWVQPTTAALLFLLLFAIALIAYFHLKVLLPDRLKSLGRRGGR